MMHYHQYAQVYAVSNDLYVVKKGINKGGENCG